jgi:hypothetical protein
MSEPRLPPPLPSPPSATLAQPIPVQPLAELAHEDQFQPDAYGNVRHRPGIITAISILSITIGSLGLITGGLSALYGGLSLLIARQTVAMQQTAAIASAKPALSPAITNDASLDPNAPPTVEERGLDLPTRQIIIDVLATQRPLNDSRRRQLHALLAKCGQDAFFNSGNGVSATDVRRAITESGQLPKDSDSDLDQGPDYFVIAAGRIEVRNDRALFEPSDNSQEKVRVSAPLPDVAHVGESAGQIVNRVAHEAASIVDAQTGNRLSLKQRQTLTAEFSSSAGLLQLGPGAPLRGQLLSSTIQPDGSVLVLTPQGQLRVNQDGTVQTTLIYGTSTTAQAMANHFAATGPSPISIGAVIVVVAEGAVSVLLSIYLLIIGIFTLRQSPRGRRLHVIYALLKIPLAIACGVGWCGIIGGFYSSLHTAGGGGSIISVRATVLAMVTGVALLYPIGLLITFAIPTVKQYYDSGSPGE